MVEMALKTSGSDPVDSGRRDFLYIATAAMAAVGVGATVWPFVDEMNPDARTLAAGGPIDVDIGAIASGQQIVVRWQEHPVFIARRTEAAVKGLQDPALLAQLRDPEAKVLQQPPYADNWHRSINPEWLVLVGVCTHLGCVPNYVPTPGGLEGVANWPGGYFCPCHGSKYDLAGRVFAGVPAPYNLPVPPCNFASEKVLRIGENPPGQTFDFNTVVQI